MQKFNQSLCILRNLDISQFACYNLIFYCKNKLWFLYYLTLLEIQNLLGICWIYRIFLYLYMVMSPAIPTLLLLKCTLHCLAFILNFSPIIFLGLVYSYETIDLDRIFACPTWIVFFIGLVKRVFYFFDLGLFLFDKHS